MRQSLSQPLCRLGTELAGRHTTHDLGIKA